MSKIVEMKKSVFLKKIEGYLFKKKETPLKLHTSPAQLSGIKIKFVFARLHEVTLMPDELSFFSANGDRWEPENPKGSDEGKAYYFRFCAPLLKELTKTKIYVGRSTQEKFEALSTYLNGVKDNKIIFEVIYGVDLNLTPRSIKSDAGFNLTPRSLTSDMTHRSMTSESAFEEACPREGGGLAAAASALLIETRKEEAAVGEGDKGRFEGQTALIEELEGKVEAYKRLMAQTELRLKERDRKIEERDLQIASMEEVLESFQLAFQEKEMQAERNEGQTRLERKGGEIGNPVSAAAAVAAADTDEKDEDGDGVKDDGIDNLIAELDQQEIDASLPLSEVTAQQARLEQACLEWTNMVLRSRNEPVTLKLYNRDKDCHEERTVARFIAIASLEGERATHCSTSDKPWPREEELTILQSGSYNLDLKCYSLYQNFPKELKAFGILFTFWEAAHHYRFYRHALARMVNGGKIPDALGIIDDAQVSADRTDMMLKLLHSMDVMRNLMGHYGYIARDQFDMDLFVIQGENKAQAQARPNAQEGHADIYRSLAEAGDYV